MRSVAVGVLVRGRYRLRERLDGQVWEAADEALGRPVMVWVFPPGFRRAGAVVAAAQAVCQVHDRRLARIFDADADSELPYVVTEWPAGSHLGQLLTSGPVEPVSAAAVVAEAAGALAVVHAAWLAHLCLRPSCLWWSSTGQVTVSGAGIAAAAAGMHSTEPVLADTRDLGRVLYAALTGCWPGAEQTPLPAAPRSGDRLCSPSQLWSGIPAELDAVACRALPGVGCDSGPRIVDPAQLAGELARAAGAYCLRHALARQHLPGLSGQQAGTPGRSAPLAVVPTATTGRQAPTSASVATVPLQASPVAASLHVLPGRQSRPAGPRGVHHDQVAGTRATTRTAALRMQPARGRASRAKRVLAVMVMLIVALLLAAGSWYFAHHGIRGWGTGPSRNGGVHQLQRPAAPVRASWQSILPASAQAFDPYGDGRGDNAQIATLAIDGGNPDYVAWIGQETMSSG